MAKSGRPRKTGDRYPCGKLLSQRDCGAQVTLNQIKRGARRVYAEGRDEWLGTQLGWLAIEPGIDGKPLITAEMAEAGMQFARLFHDYTQAMGFPRRSARTGAFEVMSAGVVADCSNERTRGLRRRYEEARDALGGELLVVVISVCVDDNAPPWFEKPLLIRGLAILEKHFCGRNSRKIDKSRVA